MFVSGSDADKKTLVSNKLAVDLKTYSFCFYSPAADGVIHENMQRIF